MIFKNAEIVGILGGTSSSTKQAYHVPRYFVVTFKHKIEKSVVIIEYVELAYIFQ